MIPDMASTTLGTCSPSRPRCSNGTCRSHARSAGRGGAPPPPAQLDLRLDGARLKLFPVSPGQQGGFPLVDRVVVAGPYNATGRRDTPSRERIFVCHPANAQEEAPCAQKILANL